MMYNKQRDKRIKGQSGLIEIWILFASVMFPLFIGFVVLMANVISAKNTVYYSKMVLNGSLYAASHAQNTQMMARGIKQLDIPKAQQLFTETLALYRQAELDRNIQLAHMLEVNANNMIVIPPGGTTPKGYKAYNDTLYIEGKIPFTMKLPFFGGDLITRSFTISASQKFVTVNYMDRTIY